MSGSCFIGRFDHYCGRVRAIYAMRDGSISQTDWHSSEEAARRSIPAEHLVDRNNRFTVQVSK